MSAFLNAMREEGTREELFEALTETVQERDYLRAENADLKISVVAFLSVWAVQYAATYGLDGLHPTHYDLLAKCGARMVDFKRATVPHLPPPEPPASLDAGRLRRPKAVVAKSPS